ncbi:Cullin-1 [Camellia lanceoleosa]|nr:Cullin-1 [Camellia lanceoleosa]
MVLFFELLRWQFQLQFHKVMFQEGGGRFGRRLLLLCNLCVGLDGLRKGVCCNLIDQERKGEETDQVLVKNVLDIYIEMGEGSMQYYQKDYILFSKSLNLDYQ